VAKVPFHENGHESLSHALMKNIKGDQPTPSAFNPVWEALDRLPVAPDLTKAAAEQDQTFKTALDLKHRCSIAVVNYKGGVGKTTATFFLGAQIANDEPKKKVLIVDIDAQCSLTSVFGIDPTQTDDHNVLTLLTAGKKIKPSMIQRDAFLRRGRYGGFPPNLYLLAGALEVEDLDYELAKEQRFTKEEFFAQCRRVLALFHDFDYIFVDCPPNKMLLTQGMLCACSIYLTVVIPDRVSAYGIPRLFRWVEDIPLADRPRLLGVLINRVIRNPSGITDVQEKSLVAVRTTVAKHNPLCQKERGIVGMWPNSNNVCKVYDEGKSHLGQHDIWETRSRQEAVGDCVRAAALSLTSVCK
jgi:chromosome partitioning protein